MIEQSSDDGGPRGMCDGQGRWGSGERGLGITAGNHGTGTRRGRDSGRTQLTSGVFVRLVLYTRLCRYREEVGRMVLSSEPEQSFVNYMEIREVMTTRHYNIGTRGQLGKSTVIGRVGLSTRRQCQ